MSDPGDNWIERDLYYHLRRALRSRYPASEGWRIFPQYNGITYIPDFVCKRKNKGRVETVICEVKGGSRPTISKKDVSQLKQYARNLAGNNVIILDKIFAIPYGVDVIHVPDDIKIIRLKKMGYVE